MYNIIAKEEKSMSNNLLDKLKDFIYQKGYEDEYYGEYEDEEENIPYIGRERERNSEPRDKASDRIGSTSETLKSDKNIYTMPGLKVNHLVISSLENIGMAGEICDFLKQGKIVIVNLEKMEVSEGQRVMDILCGVLLSINGDVYELAKRVFVLTPQSTEVADHLNEKSIDTDHTLPYFKRSTSVR